MFILSLLKISSILLAIVGTSFLIPIGVALACGENSVLLAFIIPMIASWILLLCVNLPTRKIKFTLSSRHAFVVVALAWAITSLMGSIPLYFSGYFSFIDALFESISGFSTTGSTILSEIEVLPRSINMMRCLTHWIGGMGIVTLTVALLPLLGVGGFQLIKAETTGPEKGKVTARITTTAKALWIIYLSFTVIETIALKIAGMDFIDALSHSLATLGTGGFSTRNDSIGSYNSVAIDVIITIFMFLSGVNFSLFYYLFTRKVNEIKENTELKVYVAIVLIFITIITCILIPFYGSFAKSLRYSSFQVVSLMSTTGFSTADFLQWPSSAQFFLFLLFFMGGCSGSTSGGFKIIRWVILGKIVSNETKKMLHPHGVFTTRVNNRPIKNEIITTVAAFTTLYFLLIAITTGAGCFSGLDLFTSFTAALTMVGNVGPAFGALGPTANYGALPVLLKYWYCFVMLAGRLELYTMIIFFFPSYWKK